MRFLRFATSDRVEIVDLTQADYDRSIELISLYADKTEVGQVDRRVPGDRARTVDPVTVPKHQRRLDGLTGKVISLYAKGLTTADIQAHLLEIHGAEVSRDTSQITDAIVETWSLNRTDPLRGEEVEDVACDKRRILQRAQVTEMAVMADLSSGEGIGDRRGELFWQPCRVLGTGGDGDGAENVV